MSSTPPEEPAGGSTQTSSSSSSGSMMGLGVSSGATLPMPGNAEFLLLLVVEIIFTIIWIAAESVDTRFWVTVTTVLTAFYFVSRGIAKASRVLEQ
jgi:hypothetical protein